MTEEKYLTRQERKWGDYLTEHNVQALFQEMTDALITHQPLNSVSFLIDQLRKHGLPDPTRETLEGEGPPTPTRRYGWRRDHHDQSVETLPVAKKQSLPTEHDLRDQLPPVLDQGSLGACASMCLATVLSYEAMQQGGEESCSFSALFLYYNERDLEGLVDCDAGSTLAQSVRAYNALGAAPAALWPYREAEFRDRPPPEAFAAALLKRSTLRQKRVPKDAVTIMTLLSKNKILIAGLSVYESFEGRFIASTGAVPLPLPGETLLGGHLACVVGYVKDEHFILMNSFSAKWGDGGFFYVPWEYLLSDNVSDCWAIEFLIEDDATSTELTVPPEKRMPPADPLRLAA